MNRLCTWLLKITLLFALSTITYLALAQSQQMAWYREYDPQAWQNRTGQNKVATYYVAIRILGNDAFVGKKITQLKFYLRDKNVLKDNYYTWIAASLPKTMDEVITKETLTLDQLNSGNPGQGEFGTGNIIPFSTPYTVTEQGCYVGITFTVKSLANESGVYPIVIAPRVVEDCLFLLRTSDMTEWYETKQSFSPAIEVCFEGSMYENAAKPLDFGLVPTVVSSTARVDVPLLNLGSKPISSLDYTVTTIEGTKEYHADLPSTPAYKSLGSTIYAPLQFTANAAEMLDPMSISITKVNGNLNGSVKNTSRGEQQSFAQEKVQKRGILVEEYTSTKCYNCPRGHHAMKALRDMGSSQFIGLAIHTRQNDPMTIPSTQYLNLGFSGTPQMMINRKSKIDTDLARSFFEDERKYPAFVKIEIKPTISPDGTSVEIPTTVNSLIKAKYDIAYILGADNLAGEEGIWEQDGLGKTSYNDVVLATSYSGNKTQATLAELRANEDIATTYTLKLPTREPLATALKKAELFVVAVLTDARGQVMNAVKVTLNNENPAPGEHAISVDTNIQFGMVATTPATKAKFKDKVVLSNTPNAQYHLVEYKVYKTDDISTHVAVEKMGTESYFQMPDYPVTVSAIFQHDLYQLTVPTIQHGRLQLNKTEANAGETITVSCVADANYRVKSGSLKYYNSEASEQSTPILGDSFEMPAYNVTVVCEFELDAEGYLIQVTPNGATVKIETEDKQEVRPTTRVKAESKLRIVVTPPANKEVKQVTFDGKVLIASQKGVYETKMPKNDTQLVVSLQDANNGISNAVEDSVFEGIRVAPNPFSDRLRIFGGQSTDALQYRLLNTLGVELRNGVLVEGEVFLPTDELPVGIYLLRLSASDGGTKTYRLVKK